MVSYFFCESFGFFVFPYFHYFIVILTLTPPQEKILDPPMYTKTRVICIKDTRLKAKRSGEMLKQTSNRYSEFDSQTGRSD